MGELGYQFGVAVLAVQFINWLKSTKLVPFINAHSAQLNSLVSILAAIVGALGVHAVWQGNLSSGGDLHITFPPVDVMVTSITHAAAQWGMQKAFYRIQQAATPTVSIPTRGDTTVVLPATLTGAGDADGHTKP